MLDITGLTARQVSRSLKQIAAPFQWKFTRDDLHNLLAKTECAQTTQIAA